MSDEIVPAPDAKPFSRVNGMRVALWGLPSGLGRSRIMDLETQEWMASYATLLGVRQVFAINGEGCNTRVVRAVGGDIFTHNFFKEYGVGIFSGAKVDGLYALEQGQAFWMRSADCLTIAVMYPSGKMAVLHAGRRSILPQGWQTHRSSVIQSLNLRMPLEGARAYIICGVGPESYPVPDDHPVYGAGNAVLRHDVTKWWGAACVRETESGPSLSLVDIARAQLMLCGVGENYIESDGIDTVADRDGAGNFIWASAVRGDTERNHVLIANVGK